MGLTSLIFQSSAPSKSLLHTIKTTNLFKAYKKINRERQVAQTADLSDVVRRIPYDYRKHFQALYQGINHKYDDAKADTSVVSRVLINPEILVVTPDGRYEFTSTDWYWNFKRKFSKSETAAPMFAYKGYDYEDDEYDAYLNKFYSDSEISYTMTWGFVEKNYAYISEHFASVLASEGVTPFFGQLEVMTALYWTREHQSFLNFQQKPCAVPVERLYGILRAIETQIKDSTRRHVASVVDADVLGASDALEFIDANYTGDLRKQLKCILKPFLEVTCMCKTIRSLQKHKTSITWTSVRALLITVHTHSALLNAEVLFDFFDSLDVLYYKVPSVFKRILYETMCLMYKYDFASAAIPSTSKTV